MLQPLTTDQLEELVGDLRRQVQDQEQRIKEHERDIRDLQLWLAAVGEDLIERTSDDAARHAA